MFVSMIIIASLNLGHVGSKTRSQGQIEEPSHPCSHARGHISHPIFMKLDQNVFSKIIRPSSNLGHVGLKTRSQGQIEEPSHPCLHARGHISHPIFRKLG